MASLILNWACFTVEAKKKTSEIVEEVKKTIGEQSNGEFKTV